jgi:N-glycosylase/DNA lyase
MTNFKMSSLIQEINKLKKEQISKIINEKIKVFKSFQFKDDKEWFPELCFCILAANSKARTSLNIQNQLQYKGLTTLNQEQLSKVILENKHRFHNNKAKFIIEARKYKDIKTILQKIIKEQGIIQAREWLVNNIKGIGYKEASHFLRNTGHTELAILDRHIINLMAEDNMIIKPKTLTKNIYLDIEKQFQNLSEKMNLESGELDLYMWYMKAGEVIK